MLHPDRIALHGLLDFRWPSRRRCDAVAFLRGRPRPSRDRMGTRCSERSPNTGYDGPISIEHEDPDLDPEAGIEASIAGLIGAHDLLAGAGLSAPTTSTPTTPTIRRPRRTRTPPAKFNKPRTPSQGEHESMSNSKPTSAADSRSLRFWGVVASAVVVAALAAGLRSSSSSSSAASSSIQLDLGSRHPLQAERPLPPSRAERSTIGMPAGAIDHLEPTLWYYATTWEIAYATCTPLMTFADTSGIAGVKPIPGVGQQPTVSDGGLVYKFTIKPGLDFSNGTPITGGDQVHVRPDVLAEARLAGRLVLQHDRRSAGGDRRQGHDRQRDHRSRPTRSPSSCPSRSRRSCTG